MDFACDTFVVGFWFTAGASVCLGICAVVTFIALRALTNWDYRKYVKKERKDATCK